MLSAVKLKMRLFKYNNYNQNPTKSNLALVDLIE